MARYLLLAFIGLCFGSCANKQKKIVLADSPIISTTHLNMANVDTLEEDFIDSLTIGVKGRYKVELKQFRNLDSAFVKIELSEKRGGSWTIKQQLEYQKDYITSIDPQILDFNHDGLNDMTFHSVEAARGANEVRKLFIFDKTIGRLVYIKNSESYPNMQYNKKLNCIDALLVSGCWVTVFLHLEKDTLREFANVNVCGDKVSASVTDKYGNEKPLINDRKNTFGEFPRFKNFNPLEE